jgi:hypothetical protein
MQKSPWSVFSIESALKAGQSPPALMPDRSYGCTTTFFLEMNNKKRAEARLSAGR